MSRDLGVHLFDTQRLLFRPKPDFTGAIDDKVDTVSRLEIEFPPDLDGNCDLSLAADSSLRHIPYLL